MATKRTRMSASERREQDQEVRFPPVTTNDVLMTVLSTTEPGSPEADTNAVAVSHVEFLGRG